MHRRKSALYELEMNMEEDDEIFLKVTQGIKSKK